ncbi:hypothetical protein L596_007674 [Steinernema carpocapsae]|uniref:Uncharacterized protein n=1 Tax=Steinernema carpocapsae TaxID=34508 RepID=A0A4U5PAG2_STECR|nr:hypothetical protein L596_007674 [Steinernema carpocapsae]
MPPSPGHLPPSTPVFDVQPKQAVKENDLVSFECRTTGGNPEPTFTWVFENRTAVPESWYQTRSYSKDPTSTSSILQWRVSANENGAYVICEIWNKAMALHDKLTVSSDRLNVLYPPRVHAGPANPYYVEEGERVELRCEAEGNPEPSRYEWVHVATGETHSGAVWSFIADKRLNGDFRCVAENSLDKSSSRLTVDVLYSPVVTAQQNLTVKQNDAVSLDCNVDSNPEPQSIMWTGPNGFSSMGKTLQIASMKRTQSGNYTCTAVNSLPLHSSSAPVKRTGRTSSFINVRYAPGTAVISSPTHFVNVGERIVLSCASEDEGNPKASYKWMVPYGSDVGDVQNQHQPQLVIENATLAHNGVYRCIPFNELGYGTQAHFRMMVVEAPKIIRSSRPDIVYKSGDSVTLTCEASGFPAPKVIWKKDGVELVGDLEYHWESSTTVSSSSCEFCTSHVSGALTFTAFWSDKGNYSCVAVSEVDGSTDERMATVTISHSPKILNPLFNGKSIAAADLNSVARVVCRVSARPEPTITWSRASSIDGSEDGLQHQTSVVYGSVDEYESVLIVENMAKTDLGEYLCKATNGNGNKAEISVYLEEKRAPQTPTSVRVLKTGTSWIQVGWQHGFDGGEEQHFELEYRLTNADDRFASPTKFILYAANTSQIIQLNLNSSQQDGLPFQTYSSHNLSSLLPLSLVQYRLRAVSSLGQSDWSPLKTQSTLDVDVVETLPAPAILKYSSLEKIITIESPNISASCFLVYNGRKDASGTSMEWMSVGCFEALGDKLLNVNPSEFFKIRSCVRRDPFLCSRGSEYHVEGVYGSTSFVIITVAAIGVLVVVMCLCILMICSYRRRSSSSKGTSSSLPFTRDQIGTLTMPDGDAKNTIVHGSQTDSGVFTLRSGQEYPAKNVISEDPSTETWTPDSDNGYDFNHEQNVQNYQQNYPSVGCFVNGPPHLLNAQDPPSLNMYTMYPDGPYYAEGPFELPRHTATIDDHTDSDSATYSVEGISRRVIKEIIV